MSPERWCQVEAVLQAALDHGENERAVYLDEVCAADPSLRREVESLLAMEDAAAHLMNGPVLDLAAAISGGEPVESMVGRRIGVYEVIEEIGHGGMGEVYLARRADDEYRKRVAIKLIKRGIDTGVALQRFRRERQILAGLDHPNVAGLLDGGTSEEGAPYIVMEYIDGSPITEYCAQHRLDLRARLRLFLRLADAVNYAHQHLVIHRDIKPTNVLVTHDGIPKLLDFGVAKLEDSDSVGARTQTMVRALTPEYASPEQVRGEAISTASDVYSLGVLLYELLAGRRPYRLTGRQPYEVDRVICEQEPDAPDISGDLDKILMMALRKDPRRRYASVEQFAEDIRRFLEDRPVIARRDTLGYRSVKFVRRNRLPVIAAALIAISLLVGIVAAIGQAHRAQRQEAENHRLLYAAQMSLAYQAWDASNIERVLALLEAQRPKPGQEDLRGFDWRYLWRISHGERFTLQHDSPVNAVAFSPDGRTLFSAARNGSVRGWSVGSGQELFLHPIDQKAAPWKLSPDGRMVVLAGDSKAILWDVPRNQHVADLAADSLLMSAALSYDGEFLALGMTDHSVELWDVVARRRVSTLKGHNFGVSSVAFSPDGKWLASGSYDGDCVVILWELSTGRKHVFAGHTNTVNSMKFSPDSRILASVSRDSTVRLWDVISKRELARLEGHLNWINSVAFSPDGRILASGGSDAVKLWNVATRAEVATLRGHLMNIADVAFSPDGKTLASAGWDHTVRLWDVDSYLNPPMIRLEGALHSLAFSPDGKLIAIAGRELVLRDAGLKQLRARLVGHEERVFSVAWSPDGKTLASGGIDKTVRLWDVTTGRQLAVLQGHADEVKTVQFSPDGRTLATGSWHGMIKLWDVIAHREIASLQSDPKADVSALAISPDGRRMAEADWGGGVTLWDLATRHVLQVKKHLAPVNDLKFSPDGRILASGSWDRTVKLWDSSTLRPIDSFQASPFEVVCLTFSPDGKTLATGGGDRIIKLWDLATRQELATLRGHSEIVSSLAFSPDGMTLVSTSYDRTVRLWQASGER
jgi:WD40 repeat protein/serine/threonine protein kinase